MYVCLISHTLYMTQPFTFLLSLILIITGGRYTTIYKAIHYAVFSNFMISTVPKPSLESFLNVTEQVSQQHL